MRWLRKYRRTLSIVNTAPGTSIRLVVPGAFHLYKPLDRAQREPLCPSRINTEVQFTTMFTEEGADRWHSRLRKSAARWARQGEYQVHSCDRRLLALSAVVFKGNVTWPEQWQDTDNVRLVWIDPTAGFRRRRVCRIGKSR